MRINRIIKSIMKYILKILLFLIICDACKRSDIDVFDIVEEITDYDSVYSDKNDVFNRITDMAILDNVLITKHMNDTYHFSFIDVNGKKIIKRLGKRGRGPGEYLQIGTGFTVCGSKLVFLDAMQKEINYVSISDVIENKIPYHIEKEAYPYTVDFRPRHMDVINHVKVAVGSFKEAAFKIPSQQSVNIEFYEVFFLFFFCQKLLKYCLLNPHKPRSDCICFIFNFLLFYIVKT